MSIKRTRTTAHITFPLVRHGPRNVGEFPLIQDLAQCIFAYLSLRERSKALIICRLWHLKINEDCHRLSVRERCVEASTPVYRGLHSYVGNSAHRDAARCRFEVIAQEDLDTPVRVALPPDAQGALFMSFPLACIFTKTEIEVHHKQKKWLQCSYKMHPQEVVWALDRRSQTCILLSVPDRRILMGSFAAIEGPSITYPIVEEVVDDKAVLVAYQDHRVALFGGRLQIAILDLHTPLLPPLYIHLDPVDRPVDSAFCCQRVGGHKETFLVVLLQEGKGKVFSAFTGALLFIFQHPVPLGKELHLCADEDFFYTFTSDLLLLWQLPAFGVVVEGPLTPCKEIALPFAADMRPLAFIATNRVRTCFHYPFISIAVSVSTGVSSAYHCMLSVYDCKLGRFIFQQKYIREKAIEQIYYDGGRYLYYCYSLNDWHRFDFAFK